MSFVEKGTLDIQRHLPSVLQNEYSRQFYLAVSRSSPTSFELTQVIRAGVTLQRNKIAALETCLNNDSESLVCFRAFSEINFVSKYRFQFCMDLHKTLFYSPSTLTHQSFVLSHSLTLTSNGCFFQMMVIDSFALSVHYIPTPYYRRYLVRYKRFLYVHFGIFQSK